MTPTTLKLKVRSSSGQTRTCRLYVPITWCGQDAVSREARLWRHEKHQRKELLKKIERDMLRVTEKIVQNRPDRELLIARVKAELRKKHQSEMGW